MTTCQPSLPRHPHEAAAAGNAPAPAKQAHSEMPDEAVGGRHNDAPAELLSHITPTGESSACGCAPTVTAGPITAPRNRKRPSAPGAATLPDGNTRRPVPARTRLASPRRSVRPRAAGQTRGRLR